MRRAADPAGACGEPTRLLGKSSGVQKVRTSAACLTKLVVPQLLDVGGMDLYLVRGHNVVVSPFANMDES